MGRTHQRANSQLDAFEPCHDAKQRTFPSAVAQNRVGSRHAGSIAIGQFHYENIDLFDKFIYR